MSMPQERLHDGGQPDRKPDWQVVKQDDMRLLPNALRAS